MGRMEVTGNQHKKEGSIGQWVSHIYQKHESQGSHWTRRPSAGLTFDKEARLWWLIWRSSRVCPVVGRSTEDFAVTRSGAGGRGDWDVLS